MAGIDQPPSIALVHNLERSFATFDGHVGTVAVDDPKPTARSRRERQAASFVEHHVHTRVTGFTQISAFEDPASIDPVGERRRLMGRQALA